MSSTSSVGSTSASALTRLTGLSSGLDTDSIVKSLLKVDQLKVDRQFKVQTQLEWKADALRDVNSLLKTFRQDNLSVLKSSDNMLSSATYKANKVTMNTDSSAVSITASSTAAAATMTINKITQLATSAQVKGVAAFSDSIDDDTKLSDLASSFNNDLEFVDGKISFSINDVDFEFSGTDTLSDVINKVNSSDAGVTMRYSSLSKGFYITASDTGSASQVKIVNKTGNAFSASNSAFGIAEGTTNGQNAKVTIDGTQVEKSSNSFTIDGVTYTLKNASETPVTFTVSRDIDGIYDKISNFIDKYNTLVTTLSGKVTEETYRTYEPLTDAQKAEMSEAQIEKWEEKAKSGLLRQDSNVQSLLSNMRSAFYQAVKSAGVSASDIGITTKSYTTTGEIVIDENKLKQALQKNPDQVMRLFTSTSDSTNAATKFSESGLITRISNAMLSYTDNSTNVTLSTLTTQIDQATSKLTDLQSWMSTQEENYYNKFSKMESALAQLNNQSSWLSSMVSSWSSNG